MGRYMRKAKLSDDVALMDVSQALGVRTRAKTLALRRLESSSSSSSNVTDSSCYLQLRSRRLVKAAAALKSECNSKINYREENWVQESDGIEFVTRMSSGLRMTNHVNSGSVTPTRKEEGCLVSRVADDEAGNEYELGVEASFGENNLDCEPRERSTRESTPCSLIIRDEDVQTPGSSTRPRPKTVNAANRRSQSAVIQNVPSAAEIEEFFGRIEQQQQHQFIEKYNFDIMNDVPLTGRYEWVKVNH